MNGPGEAALFTDLYELTMAASYHAHDINHRASFDLFVRALPASRNFLVAAGLEDVLAYLEDFRFSDEAVSYLETLGLFRAEFLTYLASMRFTGDVRAVAEGEVVFAGEPLLELTAPLIEAQVVETYLVNTMTVQTMVASKAARVGLACGDRTFVDFSARRDQGIDAALSAARSSTIGGARATSFVEAGRQFGLPLSGTMAHSYVMTFGDEREAFLTYGRDFPDNAVLLIDTYDTVEGAHRAAEAAGVLAAENISVRGVRLDSGDLDQLSRAVRQVLDDAGLTEVQILASGDLDEYRIDELVGGGAPIDAFGVGTKMGTSDDAPSLSTVYKLVEDVDGPKMKLSQGKITLPGRKQVHRFDDHDVIALADEPVAGGRPLLEPVMGAGARRSEREPISVLRGRCEAAVLALPAARRGLAPAPPFDVRLSAGVSELMAGLGSSP